MTESSTMEATTIETVVFPPPPNWYKTNATAGRDDMWAYLSGQFIVLVKPKFIYPKGHPINNGGGASMVLDGGGVDEGKRMWPDFHVFGFQREGHASLSFCQSSWDCLPAKCSPLVTGDKEGNVRVWNTLTGTCVMRHDVHKFNGAAVAGVDWSVRNPWVIYSIDEDGTLVTWHLKKSKVRSTSFGKVNPTTLHSAPHLDNTVAFGTKGGNIMIVETDPTGHNQSKIVHKVRHDEEVVGTLWCPKLEWFSAESNHVGKGGGPLFATSIQSCKAPTLRLWSGTGEDRGIHHVWDKEKSQSKMFRNFSPLCWATDPNSGSLMLLTSSKQGSILYYSGDCSSAELVHSIHNHSSIFGLVQCGDILWSTSYEPVIVGWNLRTQSVSCVVPTFKGVCAIEASPSVGSHVAIGGCDSSVRVLNFVENYPHQNCMVAPVVSHRLRSKIMAVAWHPHRDNLLGFGTDDGVLGVFEIRENQKSVVQFDRRVSGTVYTVEWGPPVHDKDFEPPESDLKDKSSSMYLYACGANSVYMIHPSKVSNLLIYVSKIINKTNPKNEGESKSHAIAGKVTDIRWSPDYKMFAVGYNDGHVELYTPPFLKLKCWIKCHARAIQYMSWRRHDFMQLEISSDYKHRWFSTCSNDGTTRLFDLQDIFDEEFLSKDNDEPKLIISSALTLRNPSTERVISCSWSPHDPNLLLTVSYDKSAVIWNILDGTPISRYFGHNQRLVACAFHPVDKYQIITASDEFMQDCTVHVWDYRSNPFQAVAPKISKTEPMLPHHVKSNEQIEAELAAVPQDTTVESCDKDASKHIHINANAGLAAEPARVRSSGTEQKNKKKPKSKTNKSRSLLPSTANLFTNSKLSLETEVKFLVEGSVKAGVSTPDGDSSAKQVNADESTVNNGDSSVILDKCMVHLGLLGNFDQCVQLQQVECESHADKGDWEKACFLATWAGDSTFVEKCIQEGHVTESIISCAKSLSKSLYTSACEAFAEKLVLEEEFAKAATYLVLAGKREKAVQVLVDQKLYRDAMVLLKLTTNKSNPLFRETVKKWLTQLVQDGNLEVAVKVYCSMGLYADAVAVIERRDTPYAWKAGMYLAKKCGDVTKLELLGLKYCIDCMMKSEHVEAKETVMPYEELKWLLFFIAIHEAIFNLSNNIRDTTPAQERQEHKTDLRLRNFIEKVVDLNQLQTDNISEKLKQTILVSVAQNRADAEVILTRTLALLMLGDSSVQKDIEQMVKLAETWLAKDAPFHHTAYVAALNEKA